MLNASDSVRIVDFKTGKFDEDPDSLQLPIYYLLASRCQTKPVTGISYWYLNRDPEPVAMDLPDKDDATTRILEYAKRIALARKLGRFVCKENDGCRACRPLEVTSLEKENSWGSMILVRTSIYYPRDERLMSLATNTISRTSPSSVSNSVDPVSLANSRKYSEREASASLNFCR